MTALASQVEERIRDWIIVGGDLTPQPWAENEPLDLFQAATEHNATVAELRAALAALPDPDKLDDLATWFDQDDRAKGGNRGTVVQDDLRRWATSARKALAGSEGKVRDGN